MARAKRNVVVALVTAPDLRTGRKLARAALEARLVACANLMLRLESHYWWRGKLEQAAEVLILFKTTASRVSQLEKLILMQHPYETPEFIVLKVDRGNQRYLDWLAEAVR